MRLEAARSSPRMILALRSTSTRPWKRLTGTAVLTAASLMVSAPAAADAIVRARRLPSLRVGLHLVLVEGRPVLPASKVEPSGRWKWPVSFRPGDLRCGHSLQRRTCRRARRRNRGAVRGLSRQWSGARSLQRTQALPSASGGRGPADRDRPPLRSARRASCRSSPDGTLRQRGAAHAAEPGAPHGPVRAGLAPARSRRGVRSPPIVFLACGGPAQMTRARARAAYPQSAGRSQRDLPSSRDRTFPGAAPGSRYREELEALIAPAVIAACRDPSLRTADSVISSNRATLADWPTLAVTGQHRS